MITQPWELDVLPVSMVECLRRADELWTPSTFCRDAFLRSGLASDRVHVVPNGIDPRVFRPQGPKRPLPTRASVRLLFVGGTIARKGIDVLLDAYLRAFTARDDVCLVVKDMGRRTFYRGQTHDARIAALARDPACPEILYLDDDLSELELAALYRACDALVHPYRGEGFGLPILEAMACGLPVVATAGGAADDFFDERVGWPIAATPRELGGWLGNERLAGVGRMLEPDRDALVEALRRVVLDREEARRRGRACDVGARRAWTWDDALWLVATRIDARCDTELTHRLSRPSNEEGWFA